MYIKQGMDKLATNTVGMVTKIFIAKSFKTPSSNSGKKIAKKKKEKKTKWDIVHSLVKEGTFIGGKHNSNNKLNLKIILL